MLHETVIIVAVRTADVPAALRLARRRGAPCDVDRATHFLSRVTLAPDGSGGMARWHKELFVALSRNAAGRAGYFRLPEDRVVSFGSQFRV